MYSDKLDEYADVYEYITCKYPFNKLSHEETIKLAIKIVDDEIIDDRLAEISSSLDSISTTIGEICKML